MMPIGFVMIFRNVIVALFVILSTSVSANEFSWYATLENRSYVFNFAVPESDFMPISFSCEKRSGFLSVSIQNYDIKSVVSLKKSVITYSNASGEISHEVDIIRQNENDESSYVFEGTFPYSEEIRSILQENGSFRFKIENIALADIIPSIPKTTKFKIYLDKCEKPSSGNKKIKQFTDKEITSNQAPNTVIENNTTVPATEKNPGFLLNRIV